MDNPGHLTRGWRWFRGMSRRGLLVQLTLTVIVPMGLVLIIFTLVAASLHQQAMRELVGRRDLRVVRLLARLWEAQWDYREQTLFTLAQTLAEHQPQIDPTEPPPFFWSPLLPTLFDRGLLLLQRDGTAWQWQPEGWRPLETQEAMDPVPWADSSHQARWFLRPGASPVIWFVVPVDEERHLAGGFSLLALGTYGALALEPPASLALLDARGQPLVVYVGPWPLNPQDLQPLEQESGVLARPMVEADYVVAYVRVQPTGWYLVLGEPWDAASNLWLRTTEWIPLALVPVLLLTLILLWLGIRHIVQPLQALEAKANAVAWGHIEALAEPVGGVEEIRRLQRTLHHMAGKIYRAHQSLRSYLAALTAGQEEERRRLARELHDETLQALIALQQRLQLAAQDAQGHPDLQQRLEDLQRLVEQAVHDLRRLIRDLRPLYLEELGLIPALEGLAQEISQQHPNLKVEFLLQGQPQRLSPEEELALYRITQEALSNVVRHSQATHAQVILAFEPHQVRLEIRDNGRGFQVPESPADLASQGHYGLLGMQERVERIGASLRIHSEPGQGTLISVRLPLRRHGHQPATLPAPEENGHETAASRGLN